MKRILKYIILMVFMLSFIPADVYAASGIDNLEAVLVEDNIMKITGRVSDISSKYVAVKVTDPNDKIIYFNDTQPDVGGEFEFKMLMPGKINGEYIVEAGVLGAENAKIAVPVKVSSEAKFLSFSIEGVPGQISGNEITVTLAKTITNSIAKFEVSDKAYVLVGNTLQESGVTGNDFSDEVVYTVVAEDGTKREYTVVVEKKKQSSSSGGSGGISGGAGAVSSVPASSPIPVENPVLITESVEKKEFSDIDEVPWAKEYIEKLVELGVISGTDEGKVEPLRKITRQEFVKMLVDASGIEVSDSETEFTDVPNDSWYAPYVAAAFNTGIVNGIDETTFGADTMVTREEMTVMIYRTIKDKLYDKREYIAFSDTDEIADYAKEAVYNMYCAGYIDGIGDGMFGPKREATRAEAAKLIYPLCSGENGE